MDVVFKNDDYLIVTDYEDWYLMGPEWIKDFDSKEDALIYMDRLIIDQVA